LASVGTGPARVATRADEIRPSSAHAPGAVRRRGLGRVARAWRAPPAAASWPQEYMRNYCAAYGCTAAAGRLFSWTLTGRFWHWRCRCCWGSIAGHAERRPRPCPSPCSTFDLQALLIFHWRMLSLSSWRDAPASRRSLSDGFGAIVGAVDQHDSRLARLFLLPSSDGGAAACSRAGTRRASATRRGW